jgi:hypothetical protein
MLSLNHYWPGIDAAIDTLVRACATRWNKAIRRLEGASETGQVKKKRRNYFCPYFILHRKISGRKF